MYAHEACELARAAVADGLVHDSLTQLAGLGNRGRRPQHELRDLHRLHDKIWGAGLQPQEIWVQLLNENRVGLKWQKIPVLCPYEVFHFLHKEGDWQKSMLGDIDFRTYWSNIFTQDWAANHPLRSRQDLWDTAVPISWFTDGAEFSRGYRIWSMRLNCFRNMQHLVIRCLSQHMILI
jgi:hypothetical protein